MQKKNQMEIIIENILVIEKILQKCDIHNRTDLDVTMLMDNMQRNKNHIKYSSL